VSTTEKISITIGSSDLRHAKKVASRLGLSLSTFIADAVRERLAEQERREAAKAVVASFAPEDRATAEEAAQLLGRWGETGRSEATPPPRRVLSRARPRTAARHGRG
jgi:hypothetical protein